MAQCSQSASRTAWSFQGGSALRLAAGTLLSAILLLLLIGLADWRGVVQSIQGFSSAGVLGTLGVLYLAIPLRTLQWRVLLGRSTDVGFLRVFRAVCLGYLGNVLLPLRGGEALKVLVLAKEESVSVEKAAATVVVARLQDIPILLLVLVAMLACLPIGAATDLSGSWVGSALGFSIAATLLAALGFVAIAMLSERLRPWTLAVASRVLPGAAAWFEMRLERIGEALAEVRRPRTLAATLALAFACWTVFALAPVPLLLSLDMPLSDALRTSLIVLGFTTFAHLLPSAPAAIGTFHAACVLALGVARPDMDRESAFGLAIVLHAVGSLGPALPGLLFVLLLFKRIDAATEGGVQDA